MPLPTQADMFTNALDALDAARTSLGDARDWLNSDWKPVGSELTDAGATARREVVRRLSQIKSEIDGMKQLLGEAIRAERGRR